MNYKSFCSVFGGERKVPPASKASVEALDTHLVTPTEAGKIRYIILQK